MFHARLETMAVIQCFVAREDELFKVGQRQQKEKKGQIPTRSALMRTIQLGPLGVIIFKGEGVKLRRAVPVDRLVTAVSGPIAITIK